MRLRRGGAGAPRGGWSGGGKTPSTGAGCAGSTLRAGADEDLAVGFDDDLAGLVLCRSAHHADAALVPGLVELLRHGPFGGERVARPHSLLEAARMLKVGNRGAREIHTDRRGDEGAREGAVKDAAAEDRAARELFIDVQGVEVPEHAGGGGEMRFGHRQAGA